ncbi:unnamed protein product [Peniophora sp. CBMAI 1063]|nr:unnamed protein product [Peniophora sp. CBMAI 1063]
MSTPTPPSFGPLGQDDHNRYVDELAQLHAHGPGVTLTYALANPDGVHVIVKDDRPPQRMPDLEPAHDPNPDPQYTLVLPPSVSNTGGCRPRSQARRSMPRKRQG